MEWQKKTHLTTNSVHISSWPIQESKLLDSDENLRQLSYYLAALVTIFFLFSGGMEMEPSEQKIDIISNEEELNFETGDAI